MKAGWVRASFCLLFYFDFQFLYADLFISEWGREEDTGGGGNVVI
jgi:hypothetical protein